jgi:hypothetical protein
MMMAKRKPSPGYGHELIRLERPRAELCGYGEHRVLREVFGAKDQAKERISHICQWRYKRNGAEIIVRRWVCRGCAIVWARKHIWTKRRIQKTSVADLELKGAG